ncbi:nudix hydrolase [Diplodia corticola]|uniref:Nudix hydrolase n=1 Tax=Diplodia corticola TaxID=236234 RepID=A0A1J9QWR3_9PEZI|nr:nudix hydrolase [Diplodia corticola]OJD32434.1 nudix hydrolase [Diplodia corticola]
MPRSQIPHGNRPRVAAGTEAVSFAQPAKSALHHSRPLPTHVDQGGSGPALSTRLRPEPVTRKTTTEQQNNMDQTEELARLRAELAELKLSIGQKTPEHSTEAAVVSKTASAPTSSALTASAPAASAPAASALTASAPKSTSGSGGLRGARYASTTDASTPSSATVSNDIVAHGKVASVENSHLATTASATTALRAPPGSSNINGNRTNGNSFVPRTGFQQANKSLLGQDYKPPTKEKLVKRGAVKMVLAEDKGAKAKVESEAARQPEKHESKHKEANKVKQEVRPGGENAKKEPEAESRRCGDTEIKMADGNAVQSEKGSQKLADQSNQVPAVGKGTKLATNLSNGDSQSGEEHVAKKPSSAKNALNAKPSDFLSNEGRRICISNLPVSATDKDIRQLIETKANAGESIESITIFHRPKGQPGYALVDVFMRMDASHIVKWMTDERLFGWPINVRMAHDLNKDVVDKLLETGSATSMLAHERPSMEEGAGKVATCRYWRSGHCRNGVSCKYLHGIAEGGSSPRGGQNGRRNGSHPGKRNYNFDNIPLSAEDGDQETSGSILGSSVYRSTALRVATDEA